MRRIIAVLGIATTAVLGIAGQALAAVDTAASAAVVGGATDLKDTLLDIGGDVLPFAAAILALTLGWRFAKKFVRGS